MVQKVKKRKSYMKPRGKAKGEAGVVQVKELKKFKPSRERSFRFMAKGLVQVGLAADPIFL